MIYITQTAFTFLNDQMKSGKISEETSPVQIEFPLQRANGKIFPSENLRGKFSPKKGKKKTPVISEIPTNRAYNI